MPWAGAVLLSWAGLVGQRELVARGPWCRETAVPRSSSSAQCSRKETQRHRHREKKRREGLKAVVSGRMLRAACRRNVHSP